ncbi:hypothetical protein Pedsa_2197 [Pseudopedobacter saltans DSM 12145]|uniref:Uncharacterized protein n=1 Tax=Pseudopedobacter saltans (strain ATCC 51119 / DSM 12145 / JCM 21818 / CCUG 39354 / LMG 10337 / NBRC 100064 / NCIMB 13643) TaxID=762903 RepID=F0SBQ8_PSESL|nr:DUF6266 family protein [Pseudopedobacter saltans]ADY52749.1 hypothetical protein Pedsa_2197 [Pseudopedobacter saltans DSM 12145]
MAILKEGINGPFSGKVGSIVGYQLNGQTVIRGLPKVVKRKPTALTSLNRARMKAVSEFLKPLKQVIDFGYRNIAPRGSRVGTFQAAQSYTFRNAIDYDEDNVPYVNPEKVLVFRGDLMEPLLLAVTREENNVYIQWDTVQYEYKRGILVVMAYAIENGQIWFDEGGAKISDGSFIWNLGEAASFASYPHLHIYVGVYDVVGNELSDSVYGGCV